MRTAIALAITLGAVGSVHAQEASMPCYSAALVIYDDRNPAFLPGGEAARQWEAATGALVRRSRLRRCSWQRLVAQLATDPDLAWLVNGLAAKYGIEPSDP